MPRRSATCSIAFCGSQPPASSWAGSRHRRGGGRSSAIDLPEHDVERAEDRGYVGEHVAPAEEIHGLEVGKAGRPDFALVGLVAAVGDEIDAELALGRLDRGVDLARGNVKAFG